MAGDKTYITDSQGKQHRATRVHAVTPTNIVWSSNPNDYAVQVLIGGKWHRAILTYDVSGASYFDNVNIDKALIIGADGKNHTALIVSSEAAVTLSSIKTDEHALVNGTTTGETAVCTYTEAWGNIEWEDNVNVYKVIVTGSDGKKHTALLTTGASGGVQAIVMGVAPLALPNALATSIVSLIAYGGTLQNGVPQGYTRLDRLQGDGTAYIDLGITLSQDDEIEVDFIFKYTSGGQIFGYRDSASSKNITLFSGGGVGSLFMDFNNSDYTNYRLGTTGTDDAQYTAKISKAKRALYSGTTEIVANNTACPDTFTTGTALLFFAGGSPSGAAKFAGSILEVRIKDRMHLVPAKRNSDSVLGMYDMITGQFFTNAAGSGAFIAGDPMTPTPAYPVDIVCNNGALKFTANEANYIAGNVVLGYWLRNSDGQPESSSANFYTDMMPVKPNTSYVAFGRTKDTNTISGYNRIAWYDANGVWIRNSTYTANTPGIDTSPANAAFARFHCNPSGSVVTQDLVDRYNWVFQQGTAEVPYTPYSPTKVYTDGPIETIAIKDDQNATVSTATCEYLLKFDANHTDEQEIISGTVTRKVSVLVLTGDEDGWVKGNNVTIYNLGVWSTPVQYSPDRVAIYCTHYVGTDATNSNSPDKSIKLSNSSYFSGNGTVIIKDSSCADLAAWKAFLKAQYLAGTPVIVVFPAENTTTESVTGQPMQTAAGDNTAEITQAGMAGLELEVTYMKGA